MNLPVCSPAFRRQHLLVAKQLLRIAIAPAKAGTACRNVRFMGSMHEIAFRRNLSMNPIVGQASRLSSICQAFADTKSRTGGTRCPAKFHGRNA